MMVKKMKRINIVIINKGSKSKIKFRAKISLVKEIRAEDAEKWKVQLLGFMV